MKSCTISHDVYIFIHVHWCTLYHFGSIIISKLVFLKNRNHNPLDNNNNSQYFHRFFHYWLWSNTRQLEKRKKIEKSRKNNSFLTFSQEIFDLHLYHPRPIFVILAVRNINRPRSYPRNPVETASPLHRV